MFDLSKKKVLVTGASGFVGSHVVDGLLRRGVSRENISTPSSKECDLRKWDDCVRVVRGQEIVFDLAAVTGDVLLRMQTPGKIFYDNLMMGLQLREAARQSGVEKMITIGTAVEYPENTRTPFKESDLWIGAQSPANSSYGFAKKVLLVQEEAYRRQYGFNVIHLLLTDIFGPRGKESYLMGALITKVLAAKRSNKDHVEVWGTGNPVRDFLYVDDAVEGIILAAEQYDEPEPVNLGTGVGISIKELSTTICKLAGFAGEIRFDVKKPDGPMERVMDAKRAETKFGFKAKTPFEEGLKRTIEWYENAARV